MRDLVILISSLHSMPTPKPFSCYSPHMRITGKQCPDYHNRIGAYQPFQITTLSWCKREVTGLSHFMTTTLEYPSEIIHSAFWAKVWNGYVQEICVLAYTARSCGCNANGGRPPALWETSRSWRCFSRCRTACSFHGRRDCLPW